MWLEQSNRLLLPDAPSTSCERLFALLWIAPKAELIFQEQAIDMPSA